MIQVIAARR